MEDDVTRDLQLRIERVRLMYRNYPFTLSANFMMGLLITAALWQLVPKQQLAGWFLINLLLTLKGVVDYRRFRQPLFEPEPDCADAALNNLTIVSAATGAFWGASMLIIVAVPDGVVQQIVFTAIIGMAFGGAVFLSGDRRTFYSYILPMLLPAAAVFAQLNSPYHYVFAAFSFALLFVTAAFARNVHLLIDKSLVLRFDNLHLIAALTAQKEQADYANLSKSRFLAAASHDLRQPMHALGLFVNALGPHLADAAPRKIHAHIVTAVETLEGMFNGLLDISKLDTGVLDSTPRDFAVQQLFERLHGEFRMEAESRGLRLHIVPSRLVLHSDPALLERCLRNLLSNALRYTRQGGVVLGCRRDPFGARLEVWDSGIGIAPEQHMEIFQEFYQVGNPERDRNKGVGLGLAIVQRITRLLHNPVSLSSRVGKGSVFRIAVPLGQATALAYVPAQETQMMIGPLHGKLVALVDDDAEVVAAMRTLLVAWGCDVATAQAGAELIAVLEVSGRTPDIVISDYRLRGAETGADVIRLVMAHTGRESLPGVIVTGDVGEDRMREALASGFHVLHKPVSPAKLRALLSGLLQTD